MNLDSVHYSFDLKLIILGFEEEAKTGAVVVVFVVFVVVVACFVPGSFASTVLWFNVVCC